MVKQERLGGSNDCKPSVDRISALSDELLGSILSHLTLKESIATSILSFRWKYLWRWTRNLDFDGAGISLHGCDRVGWVDRVVAAWCSSNSSRTSLEEFRVRLYITRDYSRGVDDWLRFAVSRKVERLELNFTDPHDYESRGSYDQCYTFPYNKRDFPNGFRFIKKLSTHSLNVSGEALEFFLGNCPLLELLSVSGSGHLESIRVARTFASFKCLEISCCSSLTSLVVCDSNVVCFKYRGRSIPDFHLINVPLLTEIWIGGVLTDRTKHVFEMFSCVLPQLEIFKIYYTFHGISWEEARKFLYKARKRNIISNIKQLEVNTGRYYYAKDSLLPLINLVNALPKLERFVLEAPSMESRADKSFPNVLSYSNGMLMGVYPRQLKEVEFVGYHGVECQLELMHHLVERVAALETIVVDTRSFNAGYLNCPWERIPQPQTKAEMLAAVSNAKDQLQKYVPSRIKLKIL